MHRLARQAQLHPGRISGYIIETADTCLIGTNLSVSLLALSADRAFASCGDVVPPSCR